MCKRIIGGEFAIDRCLKLESFTPNSILYASGRGALKAILEHAIPKKNGVVLLPDYVCESVPDTVSEIGLKCIFYHIKSGFMPDCIDLIRKLKNVKAVVIINYFGMISEEVIEDVIKNIKKNNPEVKVIVDDVQNLFGIENEHNCDYAFTSYRKWLPVPDGAIAIWNHSNRQERLILDFPNESAKFSKYKFAGNVLKNYRNIIGDDICLELLKKGEELVQEDISCSALTWTVTAVEKTDLSRIQEKRKRNAQILHDGLVSMGIYHCYSEASTPLFVPIVLQRGRDKIRQLMAENSIFCPIHWDCSWNLRYGIEGENELSCTELSLICDQRYEEQDMVRELEILRDGCKNI